MTFWSGEQLEARLTEIVDGPNTAKIDCAAYTLAIGAEVYVSGLETKEASEPVIRKLSHGEAFVIPPGQLAFLITEERISVPRDAMALISMKARIKWRGLLNISGFHVDPGYRGRLIFAVLNAGPASVHLRRGDDCFLIWYVNLDRESSRIRTTPGYEHIPSELVSNVAREFKTIEGVSRRLESTQHELNIVKATLATVVALMLVVLTHSFWPTTAPASTATGISMPSAPRVPPVSPTAAPRKR